MAPSDHGPCSLCAKSDPLFCVFNEFSQEHSVWIFGNSSKNPLAVPVSLYSNREPSF